MLIDYLISNYEKGEPFFLTDIVIEGMSEENITIIMLGLTQNLR